MTLLRSRHAVFAVFLVMLIAVNFGLFRELVELGRRDSTASHVLLVPFVTLVLIYQDRLQILRAGPPGRLWGSVIVLLGLALSAIAGPYGGHRLGVESVTVTAAGVVIAAIGGFLFVYGRAAVRAGLFPLAFLVFMIPVPAAVIATATQLLKNGSTEVVATLFTLTGTPYFREGYVFTLPSFAIEVADACSGIRSSIALFLTSLLAGHLFVPSPWARATLAAAILPIAVLKNGIRIVSLVLLATHVDPSFLTGQLHHDGGVFFFLLGLMMLAPIVALLRRTQAPKAQPSVVL